MYQHIMVPLDGSRLAECVLPHVEALGYCHGLQRVTLVSVFKPLLSMASSEIRASLSEEYFQKMQEYGQNEAKDYLDAVAKRIQFLDMTVETALLVGEDVVGLLVDYADKNGVDLIVIANHGRTGASRLVRGSTADRVLRSSCVPVIMIPAPGCEPLGTPLRRREKIKAATPEVIPITLPIVPPTKKAWE